MSDEPGSGGSTPAHARFTSQGYTAEDVLKQQTVGLVNLADFRKRRAEALELTERGSRDGSPLQSGAITPDGGELATKPSTTFKKRKKVVKKGGLSFGDEQDDDNAGRPVNPLTREAVPPPNKTGAISTATTDDEDATDSCGVAIPARLEKKRLRPNAAVGLQPKALTKAALARDAQLRDQLRREYVALQDAIKATDFCLPFVFFDGKDAPGGVCRMKKGDFVWLFLERARKVGAGTGDKNRRDWGRIGVDDLMLVRGDLIIPHHFDFHYFIVNRSTGYNKKMLFDLVGTPTPATPTEMLPKKSNDSEASTPPPSADPSRGSNSNEQSALQTASQRAALAAQKPTVLDADLEGYNDDPSLTKVVDRRWYERYKHIYPASAWEEYDATKDYSSGSRKDVQGNAFFFGSR